MALSTAAAGFSSQPSKQYFTQRKRYPGWMPTDAGGGGHAVGQLLCPPWHRPSAHRRRCWASGREDLTCSWETWKVWKNTLLKVTCCLEELVILNPARHWCVDSAAGSAGEPVPSSMVGEGRATTAVGRNPGSQCVNRGVEKSLCTMSDEEFLTDSQDLNQNKMLFWLDLICNSLILLTPL